MSQGLRLRLSGVYSVSFSLAASTEAPRFWFSFFSESQYRMPWLLEDGLSPFYNARVAWHIPSPGQAVESTVEVERERVTRRDHIVYAVVCCAQDGLMRTNTRQTFVENVFGELAGDAERKTGKVMHSAAEKSGRFGVCVCHTITARYGNRSHLDSQRISGLEGVCDMLIVGGMSCVGREGACQSVCMSLRKSPAEQQRATTFHVRPVACSKCLFFVTSTPCPARRTHPAHAVFTLQTSRLGRIS